LFESFQTSFSVKLINVLMINAIWGN